MYIVVLTFTKVGRHTARLLLLGRSWAISIVRPRFSITRLSFLSLGKVPPSYKGGRCPRDTDIVLRLTHLCFWTETSTRVSPFWSLSYRPALVLEGLDTTLDHFPHVASRLHFQNKGVNVTISTYCAVWQRRCSHQSTPCTSSKAVGAAAFASVSTLNDVLPFTYLFCMYKPVMWTVSRCFVALACRRQCSTRKVSPHWVVLCRC